jgi:uncharacterized protein
MNPKKQKVKDGRRARKLADEAWEAADAGNLDLAEKIIRRAVAARHDNPALWTDQGVLLGLRHNDAEAAESFRTALTLAPTFAEPYAHLAALRARQGFAREAVALQTQAVHHAPENAVYAERLEAYRALASPADAPAATPPYTAELPARAPEVPTAPTADDAGDDWPGRLAGLDWGRLDERLTRDGCLLIPALLGRDTCARLREMYDDEALFAKTVVMERPDFGLGSYRYFRAPIPDVVDRLRRAVYPHAARVANAWRRLLGEAGEYAPEWEGFREECRRAGQTTPTPILLKYGPGGFNALHRDLRGAVFFPIQMAVVLSTRSEAPTAAGEFRGGEFLLCDVPEGRKSRRQLAAGLGDAVLFCTRDRPVAVGGAWGLQPVKHGVATIAAGERFVLGVPFHEYR